MDRLLKSAKFWTAALDFLVSIILYFVVKYASPSATDDVKFIIAAVQPVILLVIGSWAHEDSAKAKADGAVAVAKIESGVAAPEA